MSSSLKPPNNRRLSVSSGASNPSPKKDHHDPEKCPCGQSNTSKYKLVCTEPQCKQNWHVDCVGLKGITKPAILKLVNWLCPFCYVAPIPTLNNDRSVCSRCRNTLSLQKACSEYETNAACEKLQDLQNLGKSLSTIDVKKMKDSIETIQNLDLHLQHLLTSEEGLKDHQHRVKSIEKHLEVMSNKYMTNTPDPGTSDQILKAVTDLQKQVDDLSAREVIPVSSQPELNTKRIIHDIVDKLDEITKQEPDISSELRDIKNSLDRLSSPPDSAISHQALQTPLVPMLDLSVFKSFAHNEKPVSDTIDEFIDSTTEQSLLEFCQSLAFNEENGHSVFSYGEKYKYSGSNTQNNQTEIPVILTPLIQKINERFCSEGKPKVNSVLINRYEENEGYLPEHSDNEPVIHPESDILTLSIGGKCDVTFTGVNRGGSSTIPEHSVHNCKPRSIYSMTRRSQAHYRHSIEKGSVTDGVRFSLTFRSVSPKNRAATCILGDSNGAGMKFGDDHKRTFGVWMPGKNFWTPTIEEINPYVTCGYKNVVIMCGINDIKKPFVKSQRDIFAIFSLLEFRIEQIQQLNPNAQIFLCPLLPTKIADLNRKVLYFIDLIREQLLPKNFGVQLVNGFNDFLDNNTGLLCQTLSRELDKFGRPDFLHLNRRGVAKLAILIRNTVLLRMSGGTDRRRRGDRRAGSRSYSSVAAGVEHHADGYQPPP